MKKMKKLLLICVMLVTTNFVYSQDQILDFFNKSEGFLDKYAIKNPEQGVDGIILYKKNFDGVDVFFMYDIKKKRVITIMIPYSGETDRKALEKSITPISTKVKNSYYMRTELDGYLVQAYFDKKNKMLIFI
jgi:hypothetical protein